MNQLREELPGSTAKNLANSVTNPSLCLQDMRIFIIQLHSDMTVYFLGMLCLAVVTTFLFYLTYLSYLKGWSRLPLIICLAFYSLLSTAYYVGAFIEQFLYGYTLLLMESTQNAEMIGTLCFGRLVSLTGFLIFLVFSGMTIEFICSEIHNRQSTKDCIPHIISLLLFHAIYLPAPFLILLVDELHKNPFFISSILTFVSNMGLVFNLFLMKKWIWRKTMFLFDFPYRISTVPVLLARNNPSRLPGN